MTLDLDPWRRWLDTAIGLDEPARRHGEVFHTFAELLLRAARTRRRGRARTRGGRA